jgi:hypothetical protein
MYLAMREKFSLQQKPQRKESCIGLLNLMLVLTLLITALRLLNTTENGLHSPLEASRIQKIGQNGYYFDNLLKLLNFFFIAIVISMVNLFHIRFIQRTVYTGVRQTCFNIHYFLNISVLILTVTANMIKFVLYYLRIQFHNYGSFDARSKTILLVGSIESFQLISTLLVLYLNSYYVYRIAHLTKPGCKFDYHAIVRMKLFKSIQNMYLIISLICFSYLTLQYQSLTKIIIIISSEDLSFSYASVDGLSSRLFYSISNFSHMSLYFFLYVEFGRLFKLIKLLRTPTNGLSCCV